MFCPNCGNNVDLSAQFCPNCGTPIINASQPLQAQTPAQPQLPMKWFKFLIYFGLWVGAVGNIISGFVNLVSKSIYIETFFITKIVGIALIALGVLGIVARFRLAGFYKNGPQMLTLLYAGSAIITFVYAIIGNRYVPASFATAIPSIIGSLIMIGINNVYFRNRAHLFTK